MTLRLAKLSPPRIERVITRTRVHAAIHEALQRPVCWIVGAAGTGKTTAAAEYLRVYRRRAIWYRIDEGDADIATFFHYLSQLPLSKAKPPLQVFAPEYAAQPLEFARRYFRNFYSKLKESTIVVFDDLHDADKELFRAVLAVAMMELPPELSCLCLSRTLPFSEFSELQIKGQLTTLDHTVLDFTHEETEHLFTRQRLDPSLAKEAHNLTQGWIAGLSLISDRIKRDKSKQLSWVSQESKPLLFYYLTEKVLTALPEHQQKLLTYTSLFPEVTAELADQLIKRDDSSAQLAAIYRQQLFISRRNGLTLSYYYHDLFREFLLDQLAKELSKTELDELKLHAAKILQSSGYLDQAIELALEAQAWSMAQELLVQHAESLLDAGRRQSLLEWVNRLPVDQRESQPWLCYWLGVALQFHEHESALEWLEKAYTLFQKANDRKYMSLTSAAAITVVRVSWLPNTFTVPWINRMLSFLDIRSALVDLGYELQVMSGFLLAMFLSDSTKDYSSLMDEVSDRIVRLLSLSKVEVNLRFLAADVLLHHACRNSREDFLAEIVNTIAPHLDDYRLRPWVQATWLITYSWVSRRYAYHNPHFRYPTSDQAMQVALQIGQHEQLLSIELAALEMLFSTAEARNDLTEMNRLVIKMEQVVDRNSLEYSFVFEKARMSLLAVRGEYDKAIEICDALVKNIFNRYGARFAWAYLLNQFDIYMGAHRCSEAQSQLHTYLPQYAELFEERVMYVHIDLARAFEMKWNNDVSYPEQLRHSLAALRKESIVNVFHHAPILASELCADGLRYNIENEFCRQIIKHRKLSPPTLDIIDWPWPVKIFVLGDNRIEIDDQPIQFGKKGQRKTLELLKLLITNEQGIDKKQIIETLSWLKAEGEEHAKKSTFDMTIHRLRKLLGQDKAVLFEQGKLKLNRQVVWVDALAFENLSRTWLAQCEEVLSEEMSQALAETIYICYRGTLFGAEETGDWAKPMRQRLHQTFIQLINALGHCHEKERRWRQAIAAYEKGLSQDNLCETFYQGLIRCYLELGEPATAITVFRRCREMLSIVLGIPPSPVTLSLIEKARALAA